LPLEPFGAVERRKLDAARVGLAARRDLEPRAEAFERASPAVGDQVLAPELQERVTRRRVFAFSACVNGAGRLGAFVDIGEIREVVGERPAGRGALGAAEKVEQGAHRGAVGKALPVGDARGDGAPRQRGLEAVQLRVGAKEHRHTRPRNAVREIPPELVRDRRRFLLGERSAFEVRDDLVELLLESSDLALGARQVLLDRLFDLLLMALLIDLPLAVQRPVMLRDR
jgi:hypothetical protein